MKTENNYLLGLCAMSFNGLFLWVTQKMDFALFTFKIAHSHAFSKENSRHVINYRWY